MSREQVERRLAAILAADIAGYSRLMGADEEGTLSALLACRREILDPKVADIGDASSRRRGMGSWPSSPASSTPLSARWMFRSRSGGAISLSRQDQRLEFRIGINVGDVIIEDGDIFGDGVNIASRDLKVLPSRAASSFRETLTTPSYSRLNAQFRDLGELSLKNIARPVHAFQVMFESDNCADAARAVQETTGASDPHARPRSIAVRPFMVLAEDRGLEFLANGLSGGCHHSSGAGARLLPDFESIVVCLPQS